MRQYHNLVKKILIEGDDKEDRTGVGTRSIFGHQMEFSLVPGFEEGGFPLLATKYTNWHAIVVELLWFLKGSTNVKWLHDNNVHIWDEWADPETGELGPVYGKQWRSWITNEYDDEAGQVLSSRVDQIANVIKSLRENPYSRRHIVTAWNPAEVDDMALPPCHCLFQFNVRPNPKNEAKPYLDCQLYQRSADVFLGVPFNIASYALLTHMIAHITNKTPGKFVHTFGDVHIYKNHFAQAAELLGRNPDFHLKPTLRFRGPIREIEDFNLTNIILDDYRFFPAIKAPIAV